jgi:hypothetical protein
MINRLRDQLDDPLDRVWVLDCDRNSGFATITLKLRSFSWCQMPADLVGGHYARTLVLWWCTSNSAANEFSVKRSVISQFRIAGRAERSSGDGEVLPVIAR